MCFARANDDGEWCAIRAEGDCFVALEMEATSKRKDGGERREFMCKCTRSFEQGSTLGTAQLFGLLLSLMIDSLAT